MSHADAASTTRPVMSDQDDPDQPGLLVIVSGPSGVGKSSITHELVRRLDAYMSVSMTTRPMGPTDIDGQDYHFVNEPEFRDLVKLGQMLEYAQVYDNLYGTPAEPVEAAYLGSVSAACEASSMGNVPVSPRAVLDQLRHIEQARLRVLRIGDTSRAVG